MKRFSKSYKIINKDEFVEKIVQFSSVKNNFVLLNSNDYSDEYDLIVAYGIESSIKSSKNSLIKLDNYIDSVEDWIFGYLSYDLKNEIKDLNDKNEDIFNLPNINFFQPKVN